MKICIDAGHAGKTNPYVVNGKTIGWESEMAWSLHFKLVRYLRDAGVEVVTTRETISEDPALITRGRMAAGCDLFLSLHSNAGTATADYPLAVCSVNGSADAVGMKLAKAVESVMKTTQGGKIWKRDYQTGDAMVIDNPNHPNFGKKAYDTDYYGVIRGAALVGVPGVLLECSFHSNPAKAQWLTVDSNLDKLAKGIANAIVEHYQLDKTGNTALAELQKKYDELRIAYDSLLSDLHELTERYGGV